MNGDSRSRKKLASSPDPSPPELLDPREEIESQISVIVNTSKRWSMYLHRKELRKRTMYALLSGITIWIAFFALVALQDDLNYSIAALLSPILGRSLMNYYGLLIFPLSVAVAIASYAIQVKTRSPFAQLEALVASFHSAGSEGRSAVNALGIVEKMIKLLPEVKRMRYAEASLYGLIAFFLCLLATARSVTFGMGVSVLVGVLIWLYFRYEATIEYGRELARFERWQNRLEEQKAEFLANL